ncbi:site-specific integrase [Kitasatospora paracochleata]|uniref:Uncharacterized protein n=1 Tax=Kitasatospora paracochleata TaxID=58354 RepID=A0ABT1JD51_9ACTN|nr:hypothetical protein [Kitasatospora paracochleata]MCP2314651.1 hypothetical protein [Kitasatospora paracochleata]
MLARTPPLSHRNASAYSRDSWGQPPADDPRVCTPQITGQLPLPLARMRRVFLYPHANRIAGRDLPGAELVERIARELHAELGKGDFWKVTVIRHARLALATREAGEDLVDVRVLPDLPDLSAAVAQVLDRAGLLTRRIGVTAPRYRPYAEGRVVPHRVLRKTSCRICLAWGGDHRPVCDRCQHWRRKFPAGRCERCHRDGLPLKDGHCRLCHVVLAEHHGDGEPVDQLWFGGPNMPALWLPASQLRPQDRKTGRREAKRRAERARRQMTPPSPHLVDPDQDELFPPPPRDWARVKDRPLPALTSEAERLVEDYLVYGRERNWWPSGHDHHDVQTLRLVVAHLGALAPLHEVDIRSAADLKRAWHARRTLYFLAERGLLTRAPGTGRDRDEIAVDRLTGQVPSAFRDDVHCWTQVLRGAGRWPSPALPWTTIRGYLTSALPTLTILATTHTSLREITPDHLSEAIGALPEHRARTVQPAMRSLFRALKRERRVFRDPARTLTLPMPQRLPRPLPADRLAGLLERAATPTAKTVLALTAIHAVGSEQIRHARLDHLDLAGGRLHLHHGGPRRTVILDELTLTLIRQMLHERHHRWPLCPNPHLIVSQITAADPTGPPACSGFFYDLYTATGTPAGRLRRDRVLDEAHHTADPVHLMRMFGISVATAVAYTRAAHPERFGADPAQP